MALSLVFVFLGRLNADEGWYLYASTLVFDNQLPYRDFAYTQTPLLPYLYGLPQTLLVPGLHLGRYTSVALSFISLLLSVALAWRVQGRTAAGLTALLFASFTYGIYFNTIVKTYALVTLFFTLTIFALSTHLPETVKYLLALACAACAVLVRLSAAPFLAVIALYILLVGKRKPVKAVATLVIAASVTAAVWLLFAESAGNLRWNLLEHHVDQWETRSPVELLKLTLFVRLPLLFLAFEFYFFAAFLLLLSILSQPSLRRAARQRPALLAGSAGLALSALAHFLTGGWHAEYFVPAIVASFPLMATSSAQVYQERSTGAHYGWLLVALYVAVFALYPFEGLTRFVDLSGNERPIQEVQTVASYITQHTAPSDAIMTLEALWVAVEAERAVLPGMTLAHFSYVNGETKAVRRLNLVNADIVVDYLVTQAPSVVVLTEYDCRIFRLSGSAERIQSALDSHYELIFTEDEFGQRAGPVFVYLPRRDRLSSLTQPFLTHPSHPHPLLPPKNVYNTHHKISVAAFNLT